MTHVPMRILAALRPHLSPEEQGKMVEDLMRLSESLKFVNAILEVTSESDRLNEAGGLDNIRRLLALAHEDSCKTLENWNLIDL